jgi:N-acetyllactosaminide beta-1,3-N-acetylglucosaminyltransferase
VHEGFKEKESFHRTKSEELRRNRLLYSNFRTELRIKYPDSAKRCEKPVKEE